MSSRIVISFISLAIFSFVVGTVTSSKKVVYIKPDAPVARITQEKLIGEVAGSESAERVEPVLSKATPAEESVGSDIFSAVNRYRADHGLPAFTKDGQLCEFVSLRLGQVVSAGRLTHEGFQALLDECINKKGYTKIAENLAQGFGNPDEVVKNWDGSVGHQALLQSSDMNRACGGERNGFTVVIAGRH